MSTNAHRNGFVAVLRSASAVALALVVTGAANPALPQTQDRVDLQQIETVPAGPSDVTVAPETGEGASDAAPDAEGQTEAGATVDETVEATVRDPETGQVQAAEAGAEPTENWFGCKPSEEGKMDACEKGVDEAKAQSGSGEAASQ